MYKKQFDNGIPYSNKNFQKIVDFFLFECPVPGKSWRGKSFKEYGLSGAPAFASFKKQMLLAASDSLKSNYKPCKKCDLEEAFTITSTLLPPQESCVFLYNDEKTVMQSLYSAIRNSFAHGSFRVDTYNKRRIFYMLNYDGYKKAELILWENTLLAWIDIVQHFKI